MKYSIDINGVIEKSSERFEKITGFIEVIGFSSTLGMAIAKLTGHSVLTWFEVSIPLLFVVVEMVAFTSYSVFKSFLSGLKK